MRFSNFILKNVRRRPLRSILTVIAVALGVGAVVSLVGIATGFKQSFMNLYGEVGIDLLVIKGRVGRQLESGIPESMNDRILAIPGVVSAIPGVGDVISFPDDDLYMVVVNGWVPESEVFDHLTLLDGRFITKQDHRKLNLGTVLANNLDKKVGDTLEVYDGELFEIVGIFDSFSVLESGAMVMPMHELQPLIGREEQVLGISVITEDGSDAALVKRIREDIEALEKGIVARPAREHIDGLTEIQLASSMAWLTSAIALVIGGVGVMNTMIMSVQERTREIGVLRAIGWRRSRVVKMILAEAMVLGIVGAAVGIGGAIALVRLLTKLPAVSGLIEGDIPLYVVGYGVLLALLVGLVGGLFPALIASRMTPTAALRQE
ncbi:ABC transporter permease [Roseimaritima ulvae]|uniref:Macrolide export ATP-binding/permease protein MacB n=1 Tax=Roseimaritima ulvae TaxID=980254 RepID=A0A5B9QSM7_9BACT|nr:ABC transporter permease [Roseimaritima ulvae]QEG40046.1 Macrolide export ATP-binding/permease protein MacB [Roseimaritima ulvae]